MRHFCKFILVIVIGLFLFSCQKEDVVQEILPDAYTVKLEINDTVFEVEDDQIIEMEHPDKLGIHITNNTLNTIKLKLEIISVTGNGTGVELCFSQCRANTSAGNVDIRNIAKGITTTTNQAHMQPLEDSQSLIVEFRITQLSQEGNDIPNSKEVNFTYSYMKPK